jgi:exosortase B
MSRPAPYGTGDTPFGIGNALAELFRAEAMARWLPVAAGLLVLYVPTYLDLYETFWKNERGSHGPIIFLISAWLVWRERRMFRSAPESTMPRLGWMLVAIGLLSYVLGRSQDFFQFEAGSQIPLLAGFVLALLGKQAFRRLWFPIFFLAFLVPVPGSLLDAILLPLKQLVSMVCEELLYLAGYPIARTGVVLQIGSYQLLIADACSGLNSMVALSGIGLLFVYLAAPASRLQSVILLLSILPIAFIANVARVLILLLVTYYFGDQAGLAFHDQAGYMEIVFAFGAFFGFDALLALFFRKRPGAGVASAGVSSTT